AEELLQLGDPRLLVVPLGVALEEGGQALEDSVLPVSEQGRAEQVFAAQLRGRALSGEQLQDDLGLEPGREVPSRTAWHKLLLQGPVFLIIPVSPKGRSSHPPVHRLAIAFGQRLENRLADRFHNGPAVVGQLVKGFLDRAGVALGHVSLRGNVSLRRNVIWRAGQGKRACFARSVSPP